MPRAARTSFSTASTAVILALELATAGCSERTAAARVVRIDRPDLPLERADAAYLDRFHEGDALFEATLREADGLGPLYIRASCGGCHQRDGRGPGMVGKMAIVESDGLTRAPDQSQLRYGATERPYATAGAQTPVRAPQGSSVRVTYRLPPAVFGRGYIEAVADEEIERTAQAQASGRFGIHGRIHRLHCDPQKHGEPPATKGTCTIGRFGLKARIATLDEFTADAFQNDMGITSPLRPSELPNPDAFADDRKPGIDVDLETVNKVADYMRLIELPARMPSSTRGAQLFEQALCATCHVPEMRTRGDYPVKPLAGRSARIYSDLLLHDMGPDLSDGMIDEDARPTEWRTPPLVGLRFFNAFLHDGRAHGIEEAILAHEGPASEGSEAVRRFRNLEERERQELVQFVGTL